MLNSEPSSSVHTAAFSVVNVTGLFRLKLGNEPMNVLHVGVNTTHHPYRNHGIKEECTRNTIFLLLY